MRKEAVLIFSGGLDSTTLLYKMIRDGYKVLAITFAYGQRHKKEIECAINICKNLGINHKIIDISFLREVLSCSGSALISENEIPKCHYESATAKKTVVPGRNLIMLSIAAAVAEANNIPYLCYAAHSGDWEIYPDCREKFIVAAHKTILASSDWNKVYLCAPFSGLKKDEIVGLGLQLNVPYEKTWSCYNGESFPCGKCPTCVERLEAFRLNGVDDPLKYK